MGRPFRFGGSGPDEFDCLGFVIFIYSEVYGIKLEHPLLSRRRDIQSCIDAFTRDFMRVEKRTEFLHPGDVLHTRTLTIQDQHIAIVENSKWAAESYLIGGVARIELYKRLQPETRIYRHKDLW